MRKKQKIKQSTINGVVYVGELKIKDNRSAYPVIDIVFRTY